MQAESQSQQYEGITKQHPVDTGIENAKTEMEFASGGEFIVSEESVEELQKDLRKILEQKLGKRKIPEEFLPALFELTALVQFQRLKADLPLWDIVELEILLDSLWERLKEFLNPPTPSR